MHKLQFERLGARVCFSSDWQQSTNHLDVDGSSLVTPIDVLQIINRIHHNGFGSLPSARPVEEPFCDTNGDGKLTPLDALIVVNALNRYAAPLSISVAASQATDLNQNGVTLLATAVFEGQSLPGVSVRVVREDSMGSETPEVTLGQATTSASGEWEMPLELTLGAHSLAFVARDPLGRETRQIFEIRRGDIAQDWNAELLNAIRNWRGTNLGKTTFSAPPVVAKNLAMIHTAMFDAVNAANPTYEAYLDQIPVIANASAEVAAAVAAYEVAKSLYPGVAEQARWEKTLQESIGNIPESVSKLAGVTLGQQIAALMIADRANDGSSAVVNYSLEDDAGQWQPTAPAFAAPLLPQWPNVTPFVLESGSQFRADAPPELDSAAYAAAVDEVMRLGRNNSTERTAEQTEIALYWADGAGTFTPPGHWNQIASRVMDTQTGSLLENARVFAMLNLALADAGITSWDTKYHYGFWRPIDAIGRADEDGNSATSQSLDWVPLITTPPFPTYTSGHSTFSGAAEGLLTAIYGEQVSFSSAMDPSATLPEGISAPLERSFDSFREAAEEAGMSRIYGGIHFGFDNTAGLEAGRNVGFYVANVTMRPLAT